jgi:hypothetical protein
MCQTNPEIVRKWFVNRRLTERLKKKAKRQEEKIKKETTSKDEKKKNKSTEKKKRTRLEEPKNFLLKSSNDFDTQNHFEEVDLQEEFSQNHRHIFGLQSPTQKKKKNTK